MEKEESGIILSGRSEVSPTSIDGLLNQIRPVWKAKDLVKRVERLLPVDPSSACQKLLNAAVYDLRSKIVTVGLDIAKEVAKLYKLPPIEKDEDVLEAYATTNIIELSYRIGLLKLAEYKRIRRCYDIRRDLEHYDESYVAVLEDCYYIFKSTIEIVLSKDPIQLLKVIDIKEIAEDPSKVKISEELIANYDCAPQLRQEEILRFLVSTARNAKHPDIIRENAFEMLKSFKTGTNKSVVITIAGMLEDALGTKPIDSATARIGHAIGATPYFKKAKLKDFYRDIEASFKACGGQWHQQGIASKHFYEIGGFDYCPADMRNQLVKYLVSWYIGTPAFSSSRRKVFYSDDAEGHIEDLFSECESDLTNEINASKVELEYYISKKEISNRFERLLEIAAKKQSASALMP